MNSILPYKNILNQNFILKILVFLSLFFLLFIVYGTKADAAVSQSCCGCGKAKREGCKWVNSKCPGTNGYGCWKKVCYDSTCSSTSASSCNSDAKCGGGSNDSGGGGNDGGGSNGGGGSTPNPTPTPSVPDKKKCNSGYWRPCNDLPQNDRGNVKDAYRKYINEDNCGTAYQISGCGKIRTCQLAPCCNATNPAKADNLNFKVNNQNVTQVSGMQIYSSNIFSYTNNTFGKGCPTNTNQNAIQIYNNYFKDNSSKVILGATGWVNQTSNFRKSIGDILNGSYMCNSDIMWRVVKNNGSNKSYSAFKGLELTNMEPNIVSIESSADAYSNKADTQSDITFTITAQGPYIKNIVTEVVEVDANNNIIGQYQTINTGKCNTKKECKHTFTYRTPSKEDSFYRFRATAYNACNEGSSMNTQDEYFLGVQKRYTLNVNTYLINELVEKDEPVNCSLPKSTALDTTGNQSNFGSITISSKAEDYTQSVKISPQGKAVFDFVPENAFPVYINATANAGDCRDYNLYCINDISILESGMVTKPNNQSKDVDITIVETKSDPWTKFLNGDVFSMNINLSSGCQDDRVIPLFQTPAVTSTDPENNYDYYSPGDIYADYDYNFDNDDGYYYYGGYLENLDSWNYDYSNYTYSADAGFDYDYSNFFSLDTWLNNYSIYEYEYLPDYIQEINTLSEITDNQYSYYINDNYTINNQVEYSTNGISVVYVKGDLIINSNFVPANSDDFITFIVEGTIKIGRDFGVQNYQEIGAYNENTPSNIVAGLVSLNESNGIEIIGTDDFRNDPDIPIVIEGFLISKSYINLNRDLARNNAYYPAIIIKSNNYLSRFKKYISTNQVGIEQYDVVWEFKSE